MTTQNHRFCLLIILALIGTQIFADEQPLTVTQETKTVHIGGLSQLLFDRKSNNIAIATEMFFKEIAKHMEVEHTVLTIYNNTSDMRKAMQEGRLDSVFVNPIDYLDLDSHIHPDFRYTLTFGSAPEQRIYLLVNNSKSLNDISQLQGKRLSIPKGYILGRLYLDIVLAQAGQPPMEEFFSGIHYTNNPDAAVIDVFFKKADLSVTSDLAYSLASELNPQIPKKTDILSSSPPYIPFVIGVNKQVPEDILMDLDSILQQVNNEPRIRKILSLFSAKDLVKIKPEHLDSLSKLKRTHQQLINK